MSRSVLLAGATGLVGRELLGQLVADDDVEELRVLARRPLDAAAFPKKVRVIIADFRRLDTSPDWFRVDQVFSALGTTIRTAGSQEAFRWVDLDSPLAIARMARAEGARHFLVVSSMGANPRSRLFYSRVKGELEEALRALNFPSLTMARPSVLVGRREHPRAGERLMRGVGFLLPAVWKPVAARQVAAGLARAAREDLPGVRILNNIALRREA